MIKISNKGAAGAKLAILALMAICSLSLLILPADLIAAGDQSSPATCKAGQAMINGACVTQANPWFRIVPECATLKGSYGSAPPVPSLVCALQTFVNIANLILGLTGSIALVMFVYGGFLMITSAGNTEQVSKGKTVLVNAVIGIMIVMTSGLIIQYAMSRLGIKQNAAVGQSCSGGVVVQLADGSLKCTSSCEQLGTEYACEDVASNPGKYCIANLCNSTKATAGKCNYKSRNCMCCYTPKQ